MGERNCALCNTITFHVTTREDHSVCARCGLVASDDMYVDPREEVVYSKGTSYKYEAHWNEHLKAAICQDPPIPEDIYIFVRLKIYASWVGTCRAPKNKRDIKKILTSINIPRKITKKYTRKRKFHLHQRFYERWRTFLHQTGVCTRFEMTQFLMIRLTELFKSFTQAFTACKPYIHRRSLFHYDFMIYFFLKHLYLTGQITYTPYNYQRMWFPIYRPINTKTYKEFCVVAHKCNLKLKKDTNKQ